MPHISNKKLNPLLLEKLLEKLISVISKAKDKDSLGLIIKELFTNTEKIMIAKRLAIILMLNNNVPQDKITDTLKVSPSTVAKMSLRHEIGKYFTILKVSQKEKLDLEKIVFNMLTAGGLMPPKVGRKYWIKIKRRQ